MVVSDVFPFAKIALESRAQFSNTFPPSSESVEGSVTDVIAVPLKALLLTAVTPSGITSAPSSGVSLNALASMLTSARGKFIALTAVPLNPPMSVHLLFSWKIIFSKAAE